MKVAVAAFGDEVATAVGYDLEVAKHDRPWCVTATLLFSILGCGVETGELDTAGEVSRPIIGGGFSDDVAVVALRHRGEQICTGTLIAPAVVLTAARCLPPNSDTDVSDLSVFFGEDTNAPGLATRVAGVAAQSEVG